VRSQGPGGGLLRVGGSDDTSAMVEALRSGRRSATAAVEVQAAAAEPRTRDADRSQKDILDAALVEFTEQGLGGARMDRIAERAGVNKRLIYYYFDSKESLFLEVLERAYASIRAEERELNLSQVEPIEAIRRLIAFTWNYYIAHPEFMHLLNSENLHRARYLKQSTKMRSMHSPLVATLALVASRSRSKMVDSVWQLPR
jgi:AcrR family transcriptional regulator